MKLESKLVIEVIKLKGIRKVIARRMSQSKREAPHVYYDIEVEMTAAKRLKEKLSEQGYKVSYNDIIIYSVSRNLENFPKFNAHIGDDELKIYKNINIGMVVGLEEGLIVPVIHNVDKKGLREIAKITKELVQRVKSGILKLIDYTGGTFTVSNLGMYGITGFHAIINPPEVAILAVGKVAEKPDVRDHNLVTHLSTNLSLSADHRVIDGMEAAKFLYSLKSNLENINDEYK